MRSRLPLYSAHVGRHCSCASVTAAPGLPPSAAPKAPPGCTAPAWPACPAPPACAPSFAALPAFGPPAAAAASPSQGATAAGAPAAGVLCCPSGCCAGGGGCGAGAGGAAAISDTRSDLGWGVGGEVKRCLSSTGDGRGSKEVLPHEVKSGQAARWYSCRCKGSGMKDGWGKACMSASQQVGRAGTEFMDCVCRAGFQAGW